MAEKYPYPWTIVGVGPGEWAVLDANGDQLFNLSHDWESAEDAFGEEEAQNINKYGEGHKINVFSSEVEALAERPGNLFENITRYDVPESDVPFLRQLERLFKGPT